MSDKAQQQAIENEADKTKKAMYCSSLGNIFYDKSKYEKAAEYYQKAIDYDPSSSVYYNELGNAYYGKGEFQKAAEVYKQASDKDPSAAVYHSNRALALANLDRINEADKAQQQAIENEADKTKKAMYCSSLGNIFYDKSKYEKAAEYYQKAIDYDPSLAVYHSNLALAWENLKSPGKRIEELENAMVALRQALKLNAEGGEYEDRLVGLDLRKALAIKYGESVLDLTPTVTPILLELGQGLIPKDPKDTSTETWPLFTTYIPEMRNRIQHGMGVRLPGVRVRGNNNLLEADYVIMLDEVPLVKSSVQLGRRYYPVSAERLQKLGIPQQALVEAPHPQTGEPGCWIPPDQWDLITRQGFKLWPEPLVYAIYHLEAVLRRNLADFLGVQEVENLLDTWEQSEKGSSLFKSVLPNPDLRLRFARVLRTIVKENVPITPWEDILEAVRVSGLDSISEAVRAVRLRLKRLLPGNHSSARRIELPLEWEDTIISWLRRENGKAFFVAQPEETHNVLSVIRDLLRSRDRNLVLVTRSPELRPFLRRLVEFEFPDLMVLSREELLPKEELVATAQLGDEKVTKGANADG